MADGYGQSCPVARALDVVGEKWSLLILRDLFRHGPLRFQEIGQRLPGVAPNTLSARLDGARRSHWTGTGGGAEATGLPLPRSTRPSAGA